MKRERRTWPLNYSPSNGSSRGSSPESSSPSSNNGRGRPPIYNNTIPGRAYKLISRTGMSQSDLAVAFGVTDAAISQWKEEHPDFLKAINQGYYDFNSGEIVKALATRAKGFAIEEEKVFCNAEGNVTKVRTKRYYPPDTSAIMYWLNNRRKDEWAYNSRMELSGKIQTEELGPAAQALTEILKGGDTPDIKDLRTRLRSVAEGANGHCKQ